MPSSSIDQGKLIIKPKLNNTNTIEFESGYPYEELDLVRKDNRLYVFRNNFVGTWEDAKESVELYADNLPKNPVRGSIFWMGTDNEIKQAAPVKTSTHVYRDDHSDVQQMDFNQKHRQVLIMSEEHSSEHEYRHNLPKMTWAQDSHEARVQIDTSPSLIAQKHPNGCGIAGLPTCPAEAMLTNADLPGGTWLDGSTIAEPIYTKATTGTHGFLYKTREGLFRFSGVHQSNYTPMGSGYYWDASDRSFAWSNKFFLPPHLFNNVKKFMVGHNFVMFLSNDGEMWSAGRNTNGNLGWGMDSDNSGAVLNRIKGSIADIPIKDFIFNPWDDAHNTVLALDENNNVHAWGENVSGNTTHAGHTWSDNRTSPIEINGNDPANPYVYIQSIGSYHGGGQFGIKHDGTLWSWGGSRHGALGRGIDNTGVNAAPGRVTFPAPYDTMKCIGVGGTGGHIDATYGYSSTVFAILEDHSVWAFGWGGWGERGDGTTTNARTTPVQVALLGDMNNPPYVIKLISIGEDFKKIIAIMNDHTVRIWGRGDYGDGVGAAPYRNTPQNISSFSSHNVYALPVRNIVDAHGGGYAGYPWVGLVRHDGALLTMGYNPNDGTSIGIGHTASNWTADGSHGGGWTLMNYEDPYRINMSYQVGLDTGGTSLTPFWAVPTTMRLQERMIGNERIVALHNTGHSSNSYIIAITEKGDMMSTGQNFNYHGFHMAHPRTFQYANLEA